MIVFVFFPELILRWTPCCLQTMMTWWKGWGTTTRCGKSSTGTFFIISPSAVTIGYFSAGTTFPTLSPAAPPTTRTGTTSCARPSPQTRRTMSSAGYGHLVFPLFQVFFLKKQFLFLRSGNSRRRRRRIFVAIKLAIHHYRARGRGWRWRRRRFFGLVQFGFLILGCGRFDLVLNPPSCTLFKLQKVRAIDLGQKLNLLTLSTSTTSVLRHENVP